ncbi:MAG: hypothetical protein M5U07_23845 [Xanthobacteraceae bacterium]|nr:hypothetical protein [Xanthobacteraceae bacterium]
MPNSEPIREVAMPLGHVEPHAGLLVAPADGQLIYKIMKVDDLLRSIDGRYLHFNRVDRYTDFPGADTHDGEQVPKDRLGNAAFKFAGAPNFSAADYYDQSRRRTYACCFSLENSDFIWATYGKGSQRGKVGVVFDFAKLRAKLNHTLRPENCAVAYNGLCCWPIFSINYGIVEYVDWRAHCENADHLPNPIRYTYLKDKQGFQDEKELRISLSALGIGHFVLRDKAAMEFPPSLHVEFDFRAAIGLGIIRQILCDSNTDRSLLYTRLAEFGIRPAEGGDPL